MIKYSGIYESSTPPPSTKALWVDGGVLKIYKNGSWRPVDDPKSKLTIDSILKAGSTNPVENGAIYNRFENLNKIIQANTNGVGNAQVTANEAKASVEDLTIVTKRMEVNVSQLQELNVVYSNKIRNLTTKSTLNEIQKAFQPVEPDNGAITIVFPHVGYLIKGNKNSDDKDNPDSTIISVEIVKIDNKDCHKFMYIDNNRDLVTMTVYLAGITDCEVIERSVVSNIDTIVDKINTFDKKLSSGTLRDLYISAGAKYNEATGYYELNGLTDITEEEMMICYKDSAYLYLATSWRYLVAYSKLRTNIPMKSYARWILKNDLTESFEGCRLLEVVDLYTLNLEHQIDCSACASAFKNCAKLRVVKGLDLTHCSTPESVLNIFSRCPSLETIEIFNLVVSISFNDSPLLSKESVIHLISKAKPTSPITITLHPTTYARATADPEIQAELEKQPNISLAEGEPSA